MQIKILAGVLALGACLAGIVFGVYWYRRPTQERVWYNVQKIEQRAIEQVIRATGTIEAVDTLKIGSLVPGVVKKMLVEENQVVKQGELLTIIDDGKDDTEVRQTEGQLKIARNECTYMTAYYGRQKALYEAGQLAVDAFEKVTRDYLNSRALVLVRQADFDKASLVYKNKKIVAPADGVIIAKVSTEGETVSVISPATVIYTLAKDIRSMKVKLEVDENRIGEVRKGQLARLTFDTYPHKIFEGKIDEMSNAPIIKNAAVSYQVSFLLDNKELLLRPGMTVNARIHVAEKGQVLVVPSHVLALNATLLEQVAQLNGMTMRPLEKAEKAKLEQKGTFKTVWVRVDNEFVERGVQLGAHDSAYYEVISGLDGSEDVVSDIQEPDAMQKLYGQVFGKGL